MQFGYREEIKELIQHLRYVRYVSKERVKIGSTLIKKREAFDIELNSVHLQREACNF